MTFRTVMLAGVLVAGGLPAAWAQTSVAPTAGPGTGAAGTMAPGTTGPTAMVPAVAAPPAAAQTPGRRPTDRVEGHIAGLQKRFGITAAQQPQWDAFTAVLRQNAEHAEVVYTQRQAGAATMNAVDDLRAHAAMERARAEDAERLVPAFERLYQAMTPEQRAVADKMFKDQRRGFGRRG